MGTHYWDVVDARTGLSRDLDESGLRGPAIEFLDHPLL